MATSPIATFLVERYWPDIDIDRLRDALPRLEAVALAMRSSGSPVEHLGSILMPDDQVVFSLISAVDPSTVRELNERAGLPADRIAVAITLLGGMTPVDQPGGTTR
jgi:hypothetical protein